MENAKTGQDKISVIVPVYNGEAYLADCIASIRNQTCQNLEIIIINDGSTDGTAKVCAGLQEAYDNVSVITLKDDGVSAARNAGIEAAGGDFITFVDADDRLQPQMLQLLYDCMLRTGSDIAGCSFFIWRNEAEWKALSGAAGLKGGPEPPTVYMPDAYVRDAILQGNSRCWSKLYRKAAIGKTRFREGLSIGEDMLFLIDLLPCVRKIAELKYPGYAYFRNPDGAINRSFAPEYMDQITCWELAREKLMDRKPQQDLYAQVTTILMMGIMLTVGKLAMLPMAERRRQGKYILLCHDKLGEAMRVKGAYRGLSVGYKIKTTLFRYLPKLYLFLYHWKKADGRA